MENIESWRKVFREGFAPAFSVDGLRSLAEALRRDNPGLIQGATTTPPPLMAVRDWPVEACCAVTWAASGGPGNGMTVGEAEEGFARACFEADQRLGEPAACRWFLNWHDDTPRDEMRRDLLAEVEFALRERAQKGAA